MPFPLQTLFAALFGSAMGSFGTMLLDRLPRGERFMGRSRCPHCRVTLRAVDLIPILSFFLLGGRCHTCREKIPWRYPYLEAVTALVFTLLLTTFQGQPVMLLFAGTASYLLLLTAFYDYATERIPDVFTMILFLCALGAASLRSLDDPMAFRDAFMGAAIPFAFFGFLFIAGNTWNEVRAKGLAPHRREASGAGWIGSGDILLGTSLGFLLGFKGILTTLFLAYVLGATVASFLILTKNVAESRTIAFGPFLSAGTLIALLFGETLLAEYQTLLL